MTKRYERPPRRKQRLGEILTDSGALSEEELEEALDEAQGGRFGEFLVSQGLVSSDQVARALAEQAGLPFRKLKGTDVDPCVLPLVPVTVISGRRCLPLWQEGELLYVATAEPKELAAFQDVEYHSQCRVRPWVVAGERLERLIEYHVPYGPGFPRPLPHNVSHPAAVQFQGPEAPQGEFSAQIKGASFGGALVQLPAESGLQELGLQAGRWPVMLTVQVGEEPRTVRGLCGVSVVESWDDGVLRLHLDYVGINRDDGKAIYQELCGPLGEEVG